MGQYSDGGLQTETAQQLFALGKARQKAGQYAAAVELYLAAAEQGQVEALYELGLCYLEGKGVRPSRRKARYWMQQAADRGHKQAQIEFEKLDLWWRSFFD